MEGIVLGWNDGKGAIKDGQGERHEFVREQWRGTDEPAQGQKVDFVLVDGKPVDIYPLGNNGAWAKSLRAICPPDKKGAALVYALYAASPIFGVTFIAGVIMAYVLRGDNSDPVAASHYRYQISLFWKTLIASLVSLLAMLVLVGWFLYIFIYFWLIYKIVAGWRALSLNKSV